jgi:DNA-binding MarR family transcriptional regulator
VALTEAGRTMLASLRQERTAFLEDRLARLDADGRARLAAAVDVLEQLVALPED